MTKLRYGKAHWLTLNVLAGPLSPAKAVAEADRSGRVKIAVQGVTCFTLDISASPAREADTLTVEVNGVAAYKGQPPDDGLVTLAADPETRRWRPASVPAAPIKRSGLESPIEDAFLSPFMLVYGTGGPSPFDTMVNESEARRFAGDWERLYGKTCRLKSDSALTAEDTERFNLILYGGPSSNCVTARMADRLPVSIQPGSVRIGDDVFEGLDVGVKFCYPNPLNPDRYVVIFA